MLQRALPVHFVVELRGEARYVEPEVISVAQQMLAVEVTLVLEER
jgi:hypothetical protein